MANVWDPTSARVVESAGMRAIATASNALAPVNGYEITATIHRMSRSARFDASADAVRLPVTADLEDG
jgi:2-methylisocitrate lyase-like PEP mutase family enzyme